MVNHSGANPVTGNEPDKLITGTFKERRMIYRAHAKQCAITMRAPSPREDVYCSLMVDLIRTFGQVEGKLGYPRVGSTNLLRDRRELAYRGNFNHWFRRGCFPPDCGQALRVRHPGQPWLQPMS